VLSGIDPDEVVGKPRTYTFLRNHVLSQKYVLLPCAGLNLSLVREDYGMVRVLEEVRSSLVG
jgi:hypothetical protein